MSDAGWLDRLRGGFKKTSDRLGENLTGLFTKAALDEDTLDEIEEALIASDLGPSTAAKVRVFVNSRDHTEEWGTIGVSDNIIEASWQGLRDAVEYKLLKEYRPPKTRDQ